MTMTDNRKPGPDPVEEAMLEHVFTAARNVSQAPPGDELMARVLADAAAEQPRSDTAPATPRRRPMPRLNLAALLGGWRGAAGLSAATLAGLWIGISPPAPLAQTAGDMFGTAYVIDLDTTAAYLGGEGAL
jgi:hypothetical protein